MRHLSGRPYEIRWNGNDTDFTLWVRLGTVREALTAILELKPDVVIADIVMPGMDGIELLKETRKAGIRSRFIMLTAMSDFEYARDALQYGAFNYLLKLSLNDEVLLENLARIKGELLEELSVASEALYPYFHRIWSGIRGTVAAADQDQTRTIAVTEKFHGLELEIYTILSGAVPAAAEKMNIQTEDYLLVQPFHEGGLTTFFCWGFGKKATCANRHKHILSIGMASGSSLSQLSQDWRSALNQLNRYWYGSMGGQVKERHELPPIAELEAELIRRFEVRDERQCTEVTALMWKSMEASSFSHVEVKILAAHLVHMLAMLAGRKSEYRQELDSAISHASLLVHVQQVIHKLIQQMKEEHVSFTDHPEVNRVIQYMLVHFKENIKIADLAKLVSINVDYLSTVFGKKPD